ncbi:MAG: UDP-N-acetylmuramoyl-tripeptide--D-alanyl-D-alanine ligase [Clostridia bacterium]|nr:UDP-N-acetylmuramoyl-tripeptide--D-alanyl-D-alanine ligase [Clostridia bacterium]
MNYVLHVLLLICSAMFVLYVLNGITYYLQLNGYNHFANVKTLVHKQSIDVLAIYFTPCVISEIINLFLVGNSIMWVFLLAEILTFGAIIFVLSSSKSNHKVSVKLTKRYIRIYTLSLVISICAISYFCYHIIFGFNQLFGLVYVFPLVVLFSVFLACVLLFPFEKIISMHYISDAVKILKNHGGITNIAITGSYGKTSTKFILKTILSQKYRVIATPGSYNTPMGITKTIREMLTADTDVFIMEFGANKVGDIKYLCKKFRPNIGIMTSIGKAHINTFKSIDNVIQAKSELVNNLYGNNTFAVFNTDNEYLKKIYMGYKDTKIACGLKGGELVATNIGTNPTGTTFDVVKDGKTFVTLKTKLIGLQNITNILLAVAVAIKLKLSKQQIIDGVKELSQISARMEVMPHSSGAIIINDGYNSNPYSARVAIDNMNLFDKKHKIVLTPGMVELGKLQYSENYNYGVYMASKVDRVYIANRENMLALKRGLVDGGMSLKDIYTNATLSSTLKTLTKDDILLIENDLPDNYL